LGSAQVGSVVGAGFAAAAVVAEELFVAVAALPCIAGQRTLAVVAAAVVKQSSVAAAGSVQLELAIAGSVANMLALPEDFVDRGPARIAMLVAAAVGASSSEPHIAVADARFVVAAA